MHFHAKMVGSPFKPYSAPKRELFLIERWAPLNSTTHLRSVTATIKHLSNITTGGKSREHP